MIEKWLVARMSRATSIPPDEVDVHAPLTRHGLDSVALIALAADLERWLGYRFARIHSNTTRPSTRWRISLQGNSPGRSERWVHFVRIS